MTSPKRPSRRQGDELSCGQKSCYRPDSGRDLTWCVYANYWRYSCNKPDGVDIIPPTEPDGQPDQQIGAPVRIPPQARTKAQPEEALAGAQVQDDQDKGVDASAPEEKTAAPAAKRHRAPKTQTTESDVQEQSPEQLPTQTEEFQTSFAI